MRQKTQSDGAVLTTDAGMPQSHRSGSAQKTAQHAGFGFGPQGLTRGIDLCGQGRKAQFAENANDPRLAV